MKNKILKSNRYKRYMFYVYFTSGIFGFIVLAMLVLTFIELSNPIANYNPWKSFLITTITFAVFLLPFILTYLSKCFLIRRNIKNYKRYDGIVTNVETSQYLRSIFRTITIKVEGLSNQLHAKVYKGELYDKVSLNIKLQIAFDESRDDVIILDGIWDYNQSRNGQ